MLPLGGWPFRLPLALALRVIGGHTRLCTNLALQARLYVSPAAFPADLPHTGTGKAAFQRRGSSHRWLSRHQRGP